LSRKSCSSVWGCSVNNEEVDYLLNELCFPKPDENVTRVHSFKPPPLRIRRIYCPLTRTISEIELIELSSINKVSLVWVSSCTYSNTGSIRDDPYWTSREKFRTERDIQFIFLYFSSAINNCFSSRKMLRVIEVFVLACLFNGQYQLFLASFKMFWHFVLKTMVTDKLFFNPRSSRAETDMSVYREYMC
jgi:hypothetical protein